MAELADLLERLADEPLAPIPSIDDLRRRNRRRHRRTVVRSAGGAVAAGVVLALVVALAVPQTSTPSSTGKGLASYLVPATTVPLTVLEAVGIPSIIALAQTVSGQPVLETAGKPEIFYAGAPFCPFCAVSRWALLIALSEFGTFSNLGSVVSSASDDVYPGLQSWSFAHSSYSSPYLSFDPVELSYDRTGQPKTPGPATGYVPIATLSPADRQLMEAIDSQGTIPFIDIANKDIWIGASANPAALEGLSLGTISSQLSDASSAVARHLDGAANALVVDICALTGARRAPVCATPLVQDAGAGIAGASPPAKIATSP